MLNCLLKLHTDLAVQNKASVRILPSDSFIHSFVQYSLSTSHSRSQLVTFVFLPVTGTAKTTSKYMWN